jgi:serine/threonine protein kinase
MFDERLIGTYKIIDKIGSGGMATVYKAYQSRVNRYVALKVLHKMFLDDKNFTARFEREAQIVGRLDHPNIVPVYDYDVDNQQPYLVMKYVEGQTLKEHTQNEPLSLQEIRHVMRSICDALTYAHDQNVLHRDIKPSNIMIANDGTVYITDFGLARMAHQGESTLSVDTMLGTPHYISPEQAQSGQVDARTDIYALGVILYELMTGRLPFTGDSAFAIIHQQIFAAPPSPSLLNPEIHPAVEAVLLKALSKDPVDRYVTANDFYDAFDEALIKSKMVSLEPSRVERAKTFAESISRHTPRGGRYQPATEQTINEIFLNADGTKSVIVPVVDADFVMPEHSIKEWLDIIVQRIQDMVDDFRQQTQDRSIQDRMGDTYQELEGQVKYAVNVAQKTWSDSEIKTDNPSKPKVKHHQQSIEQTQVFDEYDVMPPENGIREYNLAEWGLDERTRRRQNRKRMFHRSIFLIHFTLFLLTVGILYVAHPAISELIATVMNQASIEIAPEVNRDVTQINMILGHLATIPVWLVVALLWGGGLITNALIMLDSTLGFRERKRQKHLDERMQTIYGTNWRDVASPQTYHSVRKKVNKRTNQTANFLGHLFSSVLALILLVYVKPILDNVFFGIISVVGNEASPVVHWFNGLLFMIILFLGVHVIMYLFGILMDNDRREIKIQEAIKEEIHREHLATKRKRAIEDDMQASLRLSEDGEFTESFIQELASKSPHP